jgi:hypothetical protein
MESQVMSPNIQMLLLHIIQQHYQLQSHFMARKTHQIISSSIILLPFIPTSWRAKAKFISSSIIRRRHLFFFRFFYFLSFTNTTSLIFISLTTPEKQFIFLPLFWINPMHHLSSHISFSNIAFEIISLTYQS